MSGCNNYISAVHKEFPKLLLDQEIENQSVDSLTLVMLAIFLEEDCKVNLPENFWEFSVERIFSEQ